MALARFVGLFTLLCVIVIAVSLTTVPALIAQSPNPTDEQATLNAAVQALIAATAEGHTPTPDYTATVASMLETALTATSAAVPPTPIPAFDPAAITILESFEHALFAGPARSGAFLSPNGERFLYIGTSEGLCIYETFGSLIDCTPLEELRYDAASFEWSPDGRYITYIDNLPLRYFDDSDVWLFDTEQGTITNLTDDGSDPTSIFQAVLRGENIAGAAPADLQPRFSADSAFVYFVRYEALNQVVAASLYRIPVSGGEPERLAVLSEDTREQAYVSVWDISPDGQTVVFDLTGGDGTTLSVYDMSSKRVRTLVELDRETEVGVLAVEFSPAGDAVLWHDGSLASAPSSESSPAHITTLDGQTFPASSDPGTMLAGWSPDGSAIVYTVRDAQNSDRAGLYVGRPGESGHLIARPTGDSPLIFAPILPVRLEWRPNGTLLYTHAGARSLYAVRLGER